MGAYKLILELPGLPKMTNRSNALSWKANMGERRRWRRDVMIAARNAGIPEQPLQKAELTLTRFSSMECDFDGLCSGFKSVIDGLVDAGVIVDDKMSIIGQPTFCWEKVKRGQGKIRVEVKG